jgi:hypothetical protein
MASDAHRADYDGDGISDLHVYRPSVGGWYISRSSNGSLLSGTWGNATDWPVQGDYDHDGKDDIGIWRPSTGDWAILNSSTGNSTGLFANFGVRGDVPVPGDYDGDGKTDIAYWRRTTGEWNVRPSGGGTMAPFQWGAPGDEPVQADYDGDGKTDFAVWRPQTGQWIYRRSATNDFGVVSWGATTDIPVPGADRDQDHKADIVVFRPQSGQFLILSSSENYDPATYRHAPNTTSSDPLRGTDIPLAGQFHDVANTSWVTWRPSTGIWTITDAIGSTPQWGAPADIPVAGQRRVPYVNPSSVRPSGGTCCFESTAMTVPPNASGCGASGAAFVSATPNVYKNSLTCWKDGTNCSVVPTNLAALDVAPFVPVGAEDRLTETSDQNIIRINGGRLLVEHLSVRYEPTVASGAKRQGIALFFKSDDCGANWSIASSITKQDLGGDYKNAQLDHGMAFNNPYSGRVYFTVQNAQGNNSGGGPNLSMVFTSQDMGTTWVRRPDRSFTGSGYVIAGAPNSRAYVFGCVGGVPTLSLFDESSNQYSSTTWTDASKACGSIITQGLDGSQGISLVSSESDGDVVRIIYSRTRPAPGPNGQTAQQFIHLTNVKITGTAASPTFTKLSENEIFSQTTGGSILQATIVAPDMFELSPSVQANASLLYWADVDATAKTCPSGFNCGVGNEYYGNTTMRGMVIRDLNVWAPSFPIVANDASGNPKTWKGWFKGGDYVAGGFAYDVASNMLDFYPLWVQATSTGAPDQWYVSLVRAHP